MYIDLDRLIIKPTAVALHIIYELNINCSVLKISKQACKLGQSSRNKVMIIFVFILSIISVAPNGKSMISNNWCKSCTNFLWKWPLFAGHRSAGGWRWPGHPATHKWAASAHQAPSAVIHRWKGQCHYAASYPEHFLILQPWNIKLCNLHTQAQEGLFCR